MEKRRLIIALHGFLGQSQDWDFLKNEINQNTNLTTPNFFSKNTTHSPYFKNELFSPSYCLQDWSSNFVNYLKSERKNYSEIILIGYSLGGRLLLNTIVNSQNLWDQAHLISVHPGLVTNEEKIQRLISDEDWALKFFSFKWETILSEWNLQGIFKNDYEPIRLEINFEREFLSSALKNWSLSKQINYWPLLKNISHRINYWSGEQDLKFQLIGNLLSQSNPNINHITIENVGHRLIFSKTFQSQLIKAIF